MSRLAEARLVNDPFGDPGVLIDFRFGRRAILFDIGDVSPLSTRELGRVSDVFVSHCHLDHFYGFDLLLRLVLHRDKTIRLFGPPGLGDAVEAKLSAYTWNLLDEGSADLVLEVAEWDGHDGLARSAFRARAAFRRERRDRRRVEPGILLRESDFHIEAALLDHGIPCLAFALQESRRVNVHKARLEALGLAVGPWLTDAKRVARGGAPADTMVKAPQRAITLGELSEAGAFHDARGQRIAYATDLAWTPANRDRLLALVRGADQLFIEAGFLDDDAGLAAEKKHLTALQAGTLAREAGAARVTPFHFSARYAGRQAELQDEFDAAFRGDFSGERSRPASEGGGRRPA
jgi:ribonuclease Z